MCLELEKIFPVFPIQTNDIPKYDKPNILFNIK